MWRDVWRRTNAGTKEEGGEGAEHEGEEQGIGKEEEGEQDETGRRRHVVSRTGGIVTKRGQVDTTCRAVPRQDPAHSPQPGLAWARPGPGHGLGLAWLRPGPGSMRLAGETRKCAKPGVLAGADVAPER